ncbi:MAG: DegT/DnrJ/EryC1/StrS family aminotransferase [Pseudanabaena sp. Salubria-1]|jgi:dTDP-4-amino-4,6-dideoxygalactose transaminase|nr:DegT/DnrJ/EryC1/StrS family aminotransferase [Pseudanabaena sp. Salubria-1]
MSDQKIPILDLSPQYQSLKPEIYAAIDRVLESGQFIMGPDVKQFEQEVATYLGVKHAIAVNSGTDALVIGLRAMGIGSGDEVITTPFSFFATAESISSVGATPIFVDIDPKTFNIDPAKIKDKITSRTKAIMPVHLYGNPAAMTQIIEIAQAHGLKVIEDCAQSFGARYSGSCSGCDTSCSDSIRSEISGKMTGAIGDVGAYSFFPSKNLGAYGDGGLIATNDDAIADLARMLRVHGAKKKYHNEIIGYNSRLDTLQAAILRVKLPHIDEWNSGRRRVASLYTELLADIPEVVAPEVVSGHVFHQYTIRIIKGDRDKVASDLSAKGISTMIYYPIPQDRLPIYAGKYPVNPISDQLGTQVLSLPIWPELDRSIAEEVIGCLRTSI